MASQQYNPHISNRAFLTDALGRVHTYLRISVTDRCNLRCAYCMPAEGIPKKSHDDILRYHEVARLAGIFGRLGIRKIRITGGEPLVRANLPELVRQIAALEEIQTLGLTTNGVLLAEHARALRDAGLSSINISLDTLKRERFERIALRDDYHRVRAGIDAALEAGFATVKLNAVIMAGINDDEILDFVEFAREKQIRLRFIEYMPFRANQWDSGRFLSCGTIRHIVEQRYALQPIQPENEPDQVAKEYGIDDGGGTVGFIPSMSDHFCGSCSRLRMTAEGSLKTCLFYRPEVSLRDALRSGASDEDLMALIQSTLRGKRPGHPPLEEIKTEENQSMIEIGG